VNRINRYWRVEEGARERDSEREGAREGAREREMRTRWREGGSRKGSLRRMRAKASIGISGTSDAAFAYHAATRSFNCSEKGCGMEGLGLRVEDPRLRVWGLRSGD